MSDVTCEPGVPGSGLPRHNGTGHWSPGPAPSRTDRVGLIRDSERAVYTISLIVSPFGDKHNPMTLILLPRGCSILYSRKKRDINNNVLLEIIFYFNYTYKVSCWIFLCSYSWQFSTCWTSQCFCVAPDPVGEVRAESRGDPHQGEAVRLRAVGAGGLQTE